ncbi:helix-turn-helix domain-containing protein [Aristophania vespae]|uniref:Helix-turn-helix domain-containing protein n=1 Tax=Aristophania vespae TaxID=2697033 RepID=A0A6P1NCY8_9PROT|nr:AraC family transcriptional regulator [Aristophania vespae]QHI96186.1 helix-turn-helix domain-containing protein [Aristophania vespae]
MKPWFENLSIPPDRSWLLFDRQLPEFSFNWHYHPQYELTYTLNSEGLRFVGDSVEAYGQNDLVLIGPNLPHAWLSRSLIDANQHHHHAIVCWFSQEWVNSLLSFMPELKNIQSILAKARRGLHFSPEFAASMSDDFLQLRALPPEEQLFSFLKILLRLSQTSAYMPLSTGRISHDVIAKDRLRMERILTWLHDHYDAPLRLAPLTKLVHLTDSQIQRIFKRSTHMSISQYIAHLRLEKSCQLLSQTDLPLNHIALKCGFSDAAHFSRQFRLLKNMPPSHYRAQFHHSERSERGDQRLSHKALHTTETELNAIKDAAKTGVR